MTWEDYSAQAPYVSEQWASTDRGWLWNEGETPCLGHYLDYGPDYYRSPHEYSRQGRLCDCPTCQPGHVHWVAVGRYLSDGSRGYGTFAYGWAPDVITAKHAIEQAHGLAQLSLV